MIKWLDSLSSLGGAYLGNCRIYRSRLLCLNGHWQDALNEITFVCDDLDGFPGRICGHAYYQLGEIQRLRGEGRAAENAYRRAAGLGCPIQPGLALLRLAEGDSHAASAGIRRALTEVSAKPDRVDLLKSAVTIHLESRQMGAARDALDELEKITEDLTAPVIEAERCTARSAVALAEGDPASALPLLRWAVDIWQAQDAPYEVAKLNVLIGRACQALADQDGARLQFAAARETFEQLGARPDLIELDRVVAAMDAGEGNHGLTQREIEVLRLIARGMANRAIATELHLSERTVHRHVANIFIKLDVDSRTAAAAYGIKLRIVDMGML